MKRISKLMLVIAAAMAPLFSTGVAAHASSIGPGYYLYSQGTGSSFICSNGLGSYIGNVSISPRHYQYVSDGFLDEGDIEYVYSWDEGFNHAYKYNACVNNHLAYSYYGALNGEIRRLRTDAFICYGDSCIPLPTTYGPWSAYNWIP